MGLFDRSDNGDKQFDELARALVVEEHSSLRAEILASYGYAQSIVRWTLATFAAVTAAGLVTVYNASTQNNGLLYDIAMLIFGVGIPGIVWLNSWTWLGELYRAERAGSYLRSLEQDLARIPELTKPLKVSPARWESFIWSNRKSKTLWGKQTMTYLGTAGTFFGAGIGSVAIFMTIWVQLLKSQAFTSMDWSWAWVAASAVVTFGGMTISYLIYRRLARLGDAVAPALASYPNLDAFKG